MAVGLETLRDVIWVEIEIAHLGKDFSIDWNLIEPDDDPLVWLSVLTLSAGHPRMRQDLVDGVALGLVVGQDVRNQVFCLLGKGLVESVGAGEDLLVEGRGFGVFEGQVAAEHGEEDDPAGPDVDPEAIVLLALDHFGGGVAGGAAGGLEEFPLLVGVGESEVYYFDVLAVVEEYIFWFEVPVDHSNSVNILDA